MLSLVYFERKSYLGYIIILYRPVLVARETKGLYNYFCRHQSFYVTSRCTRFLRTKKEPSPKTSSRPISSDRIELTMVNTMLFRRKRHVTHTMNIIPYDMLQLCLYGSFSQGIQWWQLDEARIKLKNQSVQTKPSIRYYCMSAVQECHVISLLLMHVCIFWY